MSSLLVLCSSGVSEHLFRTWLWIHLLGHRHLHDVYGLRAQLRWLARCKTFPGDHRGGPVSGSVCIHFETQTRSISITSSSHYYLSCWYKRSELGLRLSVFFANAALAGSFGGLLAAAIANMDGLGGKSGWAWIFIIEGLATVLVGIVSWWTVFDWVSLTSLTRNLF